MQVGTIENNAHNTLAAFLQATAKGASALDWASAFLTNAGLESVLYLLTAAAKKGKVRVLTGLYQGFTEPAALRTLLKAQSESRGRLEVRISKEEHFHWKAYFVFGKRTDYVVLGSSNLTGDGLSASGEFNLTLSMPKRASELKLIHSVFDKHWNHQTVPLSKAIVDEYSRWHMKAGGKAPVRRVPLASILGKKQLVPPEPVQVNFYRWSIDGHCSTATDDLLAKTTNWDAKGYEWFSDAKRYVTGDRVILFDFTENRIKVVTIIDTTRSPVPTPDGVYFAAYKLTQGIPIRKWTEKRRRSLKTADLVSSKADALSQEKLKEETFQAFIDNLRKKV